VLHRKAEPRARRWWALVPLALAVGGALLSQSAVAAVPPPQSATSCGGSLTKAKPTADDPNLLNYKFSCDWGVSAYTLFVLRRPYVDATIDDFLSNPGVFDPLGNPVSTTSFTCAGTIPGVAINCNAGAGGWMAAPNWAEGTIDTTDPFCPSIPKGSPAGTKPTPGAIVELVVSDTTGAEDGPFRLYPSSKCPKVHVKPKVKSTTKSGGQKPASQTAHRA
jgi:hypothetical protein